MKLCKYELRFHIQLSLHPLQKSSVRSQHTDCIHTYYRIIGLAVWVRVSNKLLSLICCSVLLLLCHRSSELHCEILSICGCGSSSLLQMHIDPPCTE